MNNPGLKFISPTRGQLSFNLVLEDIFDFINENPRDKYKLIIGTDAAGNHTLTEAKRGEMSNGIARKSNGQVEFISALIVYRIGKGGRYYWKRSLLDDIVSLRQKIYAETVLSIELAQMFLEEFGKIFSLGENAKYDFEIHLDVGENGESRNVIREVVGMVAGNGFTAKTKPESFGAAKVADRHT